MIVLNGLSLLYQPILNSVLEQKKCKKKNDIALSIRLYVSKYCDCFFTFYKKNAIFGEFF